MRKEMPMLFRAKNAVLQVNGWDMDYIRFGTGSKTLVLLPGLGDGLRTVKGTALPMALMYRMFAGDYTVYAFSRRNGLKPGHTTRDMARDVADAMDALSISGADVFGVSMGGMIAQHLAIDFPQKVGKLVLAVTCPRSNPVLEESVREWVSLARAGDSAAFMESNVRRMYSPGYYRKNKWLTPIIGRLTRPRSYERFFIQADACLTHDAWADLPRIQAPTFVIGGGQDQALGGEPSRVLAERIPGAKLRMYPQWGHAVYEEEPGFNATVLEFLRS